LIDYLEAGLSAHRGVYKVPQDDLQLYFCKLFEDALPLDNETDRAKHLRANSLSESSDDGAVKNFSVFNRGRTQAERVEEDIDS